MRFSVYVHVFHHDLHSSQPLDRGTELMIGDSLHATG